MKPATIVVLGTFREGYESIFAEYSGKMRAFLQSKEAVVIRRQQIERTLYGTAKPSLMMVIDFPDQETAAHAFFEQAYLDLIPLRDQIFSDFQMYLAAYGDI